MQFIVQNWMLILVALASGGMLLWPAVAGGAGAGELTATQAVQRINRDKAVVIDVRDAAEFAAQHVQGAKNLPLAELASRLPGEVKNKATPVILVCASGARARRAAAEAKKLGYEQSASLAGGVKAWLDAGLPVSKKA